MITVRYIESRCIKDSTHRMQPSRGLVVQRLPSGAAQLTASKTALGRTMWYKLSSGVQRSYQYSFILSVMRPNDEIYAKQTSFMYWMTRINLSQWHLRRGKPSRYSINVCLIVGSRRYASISNPWAQILIYETYEVARYTKNTENAAMLAAGSKISKIHVSTKLRYATPLLVPEVPQKIMINFSVPHCAEPRSTASGAW